MNISQEVTDKDLKLLKAYKELRDTTDIESNEDLINYIKHIGTGLPGVKLGTQSTAASAPQTSSDTGIKFPRISPFYGEPGKLEVISNLAI